MEDIQLEKSQLNVKEIDNKSLNGELIKKTDVEGTPFMVVEIDEQFFGVMGQYRITEIYDNYIECYSELSNFNWNRLVQIVMLMSEQGLFDKSLKDINNEIKLEKV